MTRASRTPGDVRRRALVGVLGSAVVAALFIAFLYRERARGYEWVGPGVGLPLVPFVYFLTELLFGRPVPELARQWDALKGWQRGVLGVLVAVAAFGVIFIVLLALMS